jgi:hypothetical protein
MPSDLDQLVEMGFDPERAKLAVAKTGGCELYVLSISLCDALKLAN